MTEGGKIDDENRIKVEVHILCEVRAEKMNCAEFYCESGWKMVHRICLLYEPGSRVCQRDRERQPGFGKGIPFSKITNQFRKTNLCMGMGYKAIYSTGVGTKSFSKTRVGKMYVCVLV